MVKLAILNSVAFEKKNNFEELSNIKKYLLDKVQFVNFKNTAELLKLAKGAFSENENSNPCMDVVNCHYDQKYLIQAFSVDNPDEIIHNTIVMVKRKIHENDTYTFSEFSDENDPYGYEDMTIDDISDILKKKSVITCVTVRANGEIKTDGILMLNNNEDVGKLLLQNNNKEILYLNICNIINKYNNKENENRIDEIIKQKACAYGAHHIFVQINISFGILNCFYESFAKNKNEMVSKMINYDVYGDAILFLQSNCEYDNESYLELDDTLFKRLYDIIVDQKRLKRENVNFFNIYRETAQI
jgi:hypothetical protein